MPRPCCAVSSERRARKKKDTRPGQSGRADEACFAGEPVCRWFGNVRRDSMKLSRSVMQKGSAQWHERNRSPLTGFQGPAVRKFFFFPSFFFFCDPRKRGRPLAVGSDSRVCCGVRQSWVFLSWRGIAPMDHNNKACPG